MPSIIQKIEEYLTPALTELGYSIVRISILGSSRNKTLQLMIEKDTGESVNINDCEIVSKEASVLLDVLDPIREHYNLEVSSTGINRPLVKYKDYVRFCGNNVFIKTYISKYNKKIFRGILESVSEHTIKLKLKEALLNGDFFIELAYDEISSAELDNEINYS